MEDTRLNTRRESCLDFLNLGKTCYDSWKGLPFHPPRMKRILDCITNEIGSITELKYRVVELGPGGGRWTYTILSKFRECGFPIKLDYILLGTHAEFTLTHRDCIAPFFVFPVPYNKVIRIPTGGRCDRLISEIRFTPIISHHFRAVDANNKSFVPRIDTFFAFDSLRYLDDFRLKPVLQSIKQCIIPSAGTLFTNIELGQCDSFEKFYNACGFVELIDPVEFDGCLYYCLRSN